MTLHPSHQARTMPDKPAHRMGRHAFVEGETEFATDSPLEGDGLELSVPRERRYRDLTFCASSMSRRTRATGMPPQP